MCAQHRSAPSSPPSQLKTTPPHSYSVPSSTTISGTQRSNYQRKTVTPARRDLWVLTLRMRQICKNNHKTQHRDA
ncbi:hypothetical protein FGO68_gene8359 [Halteria grandinella]|uniref:Uncharacterized protein n=1 Tax=Halteria grandinella TaxID=5974 RepID=A0A8J8T5U5_HALGN|nr:hypothetical protein FGO68_gene8359 [Halteria grandinella]